MTEPLRVDPVDLFVASDHLAMCYNEHLEVHEATTAGIEGAAPGWVGSSAAALQAKLPELQAIAAHIGNELQHHRDAFRRAGHDYENTNETGAGHITRAGQNF